MGGYPGVLAQQWNVTDQQLMSDLQLATLEPDDAGATWPSGMWTQSDVVSWINEVVWEFLHRTGLTCEISFIAGVPNQSQYGLPQDTITLRRIAWRAGDSGTGYEELTLVDTFQQDQTDPTWPANQEQAPTAYLLNLLQSLTVRVAPTPNDVGEAEITTTVLGTPADGTGIPLPVPDDYVPYIMWGVLAIMFGKIGESSDPERAQYCRERYEEGVELARLMATGVAFA